MSAEKIRIRLANGEDALEFLRLEALCFGMKTDRNTIYFWTPVVSYLWTFKAEVAGRLVGGIIAMPTRNGDWYVNSLFVHPRYRKRSIATRLLKKIIGIAAGKKIWLDVKTDRQFVLDFYKKHGFIVKKLKRNYYRDGTDRYLLLR